MIDQNETSGQRCPLPPLSKVRPESGRHYWPGKSNVATPNTGEGLQEWTVRRIGGKDSELIEVAGSTWKTMEQLSVGWRLAPDDPRYADADAKGPFAERHIHAWWQSGSHEMHADYVRFMSWGPLSGTEEFLVFVDGVLLGRGGNFTCPPGRVSRNWPLAIPLDDQLLLFDGYFDGGPDLSTFTGLSHWRRESV